MADNKLIMKRKHKDAWDTIHFTTNANYMGMDSSNTEENVNKKLSEIINTQQHVQASAVLNNVLKVIDLYSKKVLFESNLLSSFSESSDIGLDTTIIPNTKLDMIPLLFKFDGDNLDILPDNSSECHIKVKKQRRSGEIYVYDESRITDGVTLVTKDNLQELRTEYRTDIIEVGDYIFNTSEPLIMPEYEYIYYFQRKFTRNVSVNWSGEKDVVFSKAIKFSPPKIIVQCLDSDDDVIQSYAINDDSPKTITVKNGTKKMKSYMRLRNLVGGFSPESTKHILKLELYNTFTKTVGNTVAAMKLNDRGEEDTALFDGEVRYRPYDTIEFSHDLSTIEFNITPTDIQTITIGFSNIDGINIISGVWNKKNSRLEF